MKKRTNRFIPLARREVVVIVPGAVIHKAVLACIDRTRQSRLFREHLGLLAIARLVGYDSDSVDSATDVLASSEHSDMRGLIEHAVEHFGKHDEAASNGLFLTCMVAAADNKRLTESEHTAVGGGIIPLLLPAAAIVAYLKCAAMTHFVVPQPGQTSRRVSAAHLLLAAYTAIGTDTTEAMCRLLMRAMRHELTEQDVVNVFAAAEQTQQPMKAAPADGNGDKTNRGLPGETESRRPDATA